MCIRDRVWAVSDPLGRSIEMPVGILITARHLPATHPVAGTGAVRGIRHAEHPKPYGCTQSADCQGFPAFDVRPDGQGIRQPISQATAISQFAVIETGNAIPLPQDPETGSIIRESFFQPLACDVEGQCGRYQMCIRDRSWRIKNDQKQKTLEVSNKGPIHVHLRNLTFAKPDGMKTDPGGAAGYILPGKTMSWPVTAKMGSGSTLLGIINGKQLVRINAANVEEAD